MLYLQTLVPNNNKKVNNAYNLNCINIVECRPVARQLLQNKHVYNNHY
jgi:hypothetical protein